MAGSPTQIEKVVDLTGGVQNAARAPLTYPGNAVFDARNVEFLPNGGFRTRKGAVPVGYVDQAGVGNISKLAQVRFPLNATQALLAQAAVDAGLYAHEVSVFPDAATSPDDTILSWGNGNEEGSNFFLDLTCITDIDDNESYIQGNTWFACALAPLTIPVDATGIMVRFEWTMRTPLAGSASGGVKPAIFKFYPDDEWHTTYTQGSYIQSIDEWSTHTYDVTNNPVTGLPWIPADLNTTTTMFGGGGPVYCQFRFGLYMDSADSWLTANQISFFRMFIIYTPGGTGPDEGDEIVAGGVQGDFIYVRLNTVDEGDIESLTDLLDGTDPFELDSEPMSVTTLGDRAIIAHPDHVPLVYGRCHEADASDWMYPKAALWSQDGEHWEDITRYVCDPDIDTLAPIDRMRTYGKIAICTDMPNVDGFYFEMGTGNAGGDTEYLTAVTSVTFDEATDFTTENFQGAIVNWVQDSGGATGHFEDGTATPLTLGPGNDCPYIEAGMKIVKSGGYAYIAEISGDGEQADEVTLDRTFVNAAVTGIYGLELGTATEGIKLTRAEGDTLDTAWTKTLTNSTDTAGYALRVIVSAAELLVSGTGIVTVEMTVTDGTIVRAYIVERDGTSADGVAAPTQLYFKNATTDQYTDYSLESPTGTTTSTARTWGPYAIDIAKDYLINVDILKYAHYAGTGPSTTKTVTNPAYTAWAAQLAALGPAPPQTLGSWTSTLSG